MRRKKSVEQKRKEAKLRMRRIRKNEYEEKRLSKLQKVKESTVQSQGHESLDEKRQRCEKKKSVEQKRKEAKLRMRRLQKNEYEEKRLSRLQKVKESPVQSQGHESPDEKKQRCEKDFDQHVTSLFHNMNMDRNSQRKNYRPDRFDSGQSSRDSKGGHSKWDKCDTKSTSGVSDRKSRDSVRPNSDKTNPSYGHKDNRGSSAGRIGQRDRSNSRGRYNPGREFGKFRGNGQGNHNKYQHHDRNKYQWTAQRNKNEGQWNPQNYPSLLGQPPGGSFRHYNDNPVPYQQSDFAQYRPGQDSYGDSDERNNCFQNDMYNYGNSNYHTFDNPQRGWNDSMHNNGQNTFKSEQPSDQGVCAQQKGMLKGKEGSSKSPEKSKDSRTLELSLKASQIIDSVLKGEKAPAVAPKKADNAISAMESSIKDGGDIIDRTERLCQNFRLQRELAQERKQNSARDKEREEEILRKELTRKSTSIPVSSKSVLSTRQEKPKLFNKGRSNLNTTKAVRSSPIPNIHVKQKTDLQTERSLTGVTQTVLNQSHDSSSSSSSKKTSLAVPRSATNFKDSVLKMIKYPRSRRGTHEIERILQKSKGAGTSRHRLLNVMHQQKMIPQHEDSSVQFGELTPDIQEHILSLIDQVMVEIDPDDVILLSDDDKLDGTPDSVHGFSSPCYQPTYSPSTSRQVSFSDSVEMTDIQHHFDDLVPNDPDLDSILSSVGFLDDSSMGFLDDEPEISQHGSVLPGIVAYSSEQGSTSSICSRERQICSVISPDARTKGASIMQEIKRKAKENSPSRKSLQSKKITNRNKLISQPDTDTSQKLVRLHSPHSSAQTATVYVADEFHIVNQPETRSDQFLCDITVKTEPCDSNDVVSSGIDLSKEVVQHPHANKQITAQKQKGYEQPVRDDIVLSSSSESVVMEIDSPTDYHDNISLTGKSGSKRARERSNLNTVPSPSESKGKRPKVSQLETGGKGIGMVDELYSITMEEEEIHQNMTEAENTIQELTELLKKTESSLRKQKEHQKELKEREKNLRNRRIHLLMDAKYRQTNTPLEPDSTRVSASHDADSSTNQYPPDNGDKTDNRQEMVPVTVDSTPNLPAPKPNSSTSVIKQEQSESVVVKMEPDTTEHVESGENDRELMSIDKQKETSSKSVPEQCESKNSHTDSNPTASPSGQPFINIPGQGQNIEVTEHNPNVSVKYLGSFVDEGIGIESILKQLSQNFTKASYVVVNNSGLADEKSPEAESSGVKSTAKPSTDQKILKNIDMEQNLSGTATKQKQEYKSEIHSHDQSVSQTLDKVEIKPTRTRTRSGSLPHPNIKASEVKSSARKRSASQSEADKRSVSAGSVFKIPEVPPERKLNKKALKSKGGRNKSNVRTSVDSDSSSDNSGKKTKHKPKSKSKKKKDVGTSQIMKQYLYGSSSTDVEIEGLETKNLSHLSSSFRKSESSKCTDSELDISGDSGSLTKQEHHKGYHQWYKSFQKLTGPVTCMKLWGKQLASTDRDGKIHCYKRKTNFPKSVLKVTRHRKSVRFLHIATDLEQKGGVFMYSGSEDKTLLISDFKTGMHKSEHQCPAPIASGCLNWGKIYLGLTNGTLVVFDLIKHQLESTFTIGSKERAIVEIATAQEGARKLLCMCEEGEPCIYIRDARNYLFIRSLEGHTKTPSVLRIKNHLVFSGGDDKMVQIHNLNTGEMESLLRFQSQITQLLVDNVLLVGEKRGVINVIHLKSHNRERVLYTADCSPVTALALDKEHQLVYIGEESGSIGAVSLQGRTVTCQFSRCSEFSFGLGRHLLHHLIKDHIEPCINISTTKQDENVFMFKCLWKDCGETISIMSDAQEAVPHMNTHIPDWLSS